MESKKGRKEAKKKREKEKEEKRKGKREKEDKRTKGQKKRYSGQKKGNEKQKRWFFRYDFGKLFQIRHEKAFKIDGTIYTPDPKCCLVRIFL